MKKAEKNCDLGKYSGKARILIPMIQKLSERKDKFNFWNLILQIKLCANKIFNLVSLVDEKLYRIKKRES